MRKSLIERFQDLESQSLFHWTRGDLHSPIHIFHSHLSTPLKSTSETVKAREASSFTTNLKGQTISGSRVGLIGPITPCAWIDYQKEQCLHDDLRPISIIGMRCHAYKIYKYIQSLKFLFIFFRAFTCTISGFEYRCYSCSLMQKTQLFMLYVW